MDAIRDKHNFVPLEAHGLAVGLKDGLMGNSEVGLVLFVPIRGGHLQQPLEHWCWSNCLAGYRQD